MIEVIWQLHVILSGLKEMTAELSFYWKNDCVPLFKKFKNYYSQIKITTKGKVMMIYCYLYK